MVRGPFGFSRRGRGEAAATLAVGGLPARLRQDLIRSGSLHRAGEVQESPLRCPQPRCAGRLSIHRSLVPSRIHASCPACDYEATVSNWERTPFDLSRVRSAEETGPRHSLRISLSDHDMLRQLQVIDLESQRVVYTARQVGQGVVLSASAAELETLAACIALEASVEVHPARVRRLHRLLDSLQLHPTA